MEYLQHWKLLMMGHIRIILEATHFNMGKGGVCEALKYILKENYIAYTIKLYGEGWYEAYYKDYFFDCKGIYYFLHFGISD